MVILYFLKRARCLSGRIDYIHMEASTFVTLVILSKTAAEI